MDKVLNDALMPMVNEGMLSMDRIMELISLRDFIDRISTKEYISRRLVEQLKEACGEAPDVVTWGDYFQTELASSMKDSSDETFEKAIAIVRFDMMSSLEIFQNKSKEFFDWIDEQYYLTASRGGHTVKPADEESVQLKIMKDYYVQMGLVDCCTPAEKRWFASYEEAAAI